MMVRFFAKRFVMTKHAFFVDMSACVPLGLFTRVVVLLALALPMPTIVSADIHVGSGSSVHFADATVDLACGSLEVDGAADSENGSIFNLANFSVTGGAFSLRSSGLSLGQDFTNSGTFSSSMASVSVVDACGNGTSQFAGTNNFSVLSVSTVIGKQLIFPAGLAQTVTNSLTLHGAPGNLLRISSSSAGHQGLLALAGGATQDIAYVDATDNKASVTPIAPGAPSHYESINGGDLTHWFDTNAGGSGGASSAIASAPSLNNFSLVLLSGASLALGLQAGRNRRLGLRSILRTAA